MRLIATADGDTLTIAVWNGGEPIPAANLARIFRAVLAQLDLGATRRLGLGLHICDQIVKAHGGTLEVVSSRDGGPGSRPACPRRRSTPRTERRARFDRVGRLTGAFAGSRRARQRRPWATKKSVTAWPASSWSLIKPPSTAPLA